MPTERVELAGGRTLCVERFGARDGAPVLYFHGLPGSRLDFVLRDDVFSKAGVDVCRFVRGRTLLDWPRDVEALADRLGLDRFAVAGYSSGGKYSIACAAAPPERVSLAASLAGTGPPEIPGFRKSLDAYDRVTMTLATRARPLARRIPGAQLTVMGGRGHLPAEGLVPVARALASDAAS